MLEKWLSLTHVNFLKNVRIFPKSHMHIFNVFITTVQGLKNVSLKVWEELITRSRYPIKDARPPGIHHSKSRMHFVQQGQKSYLTSETIPYSSTNHWVFCLLHFLCISNMFVSNLKGFRAFTKQNVIIKKHDVIISFFIFTVKKKHLFFFTVKITVWRYRILFKA
jgi:hypothetical protein